MTFLSQGCARQDADVDFGDTLRTLWAIDLVTLISSTVERSGVSASDAIARFTSIRT